MLYQRIFAPYFQAMDLEICYAGRTSASNLFDWNSDQTNSGGGSQTEPSRCYLGLIK
jgi:hypothetical protein